jgi:hypothetical protein
MTKIPQPTPFPLRMPDDLRTRIEHLAKANGRSTNSEIVAVLEAVTGGISGLANVPVEALLKEAAVRMGATVQINVIHAKSPITETKKKSK